MDVSTPPVLLGASTPDNPGVVALLSVCESLLCLRNTLPYMYYFQTVSPVQRNLGFFEFYVNVIIHTFFSDCFFFFFFICSK